MSFGRWEPLATARVPDGPGLLQARREQGAAGLHDYPTGKSAMVYYDGDDAQLAAAVARLRARVAAGSPAPLYVRFAPPEAGRAPSQSLAAALRQFAARFGAPPLFNG
jgi:hypothetical protein